MKTYTITNGSASKAFVGISSYLNFWETPQNRPVKKEDLLCRAWLATGRQLRKALKEYEQGNAQSQENANGRNSPE